MARLTYYLPTNATTAYNTTVKITELTSTEVTYTSGTIRSVYEGSFDILFGTLVGGTVTEISSYQGAALVSQATGLSDNLVTLQQALVTLNPSYYYSVLLGSNAVVQGSSGNDTLTGGPNTTFISGGGNDVITGSGISTLDVPYGYRQVTLPVGSSGTLTTPGGTDTLSDIQDLQFVDGRVTYDVNDHAAEVSRLYQAAFGRAADQSGLSGWTSALDQGASLTSVAAALAASPEFAARYPTASGGNPSAFVQQLYQNTLGRAADSAGLASWTGQLTSGALSRAQVLTDFSESPENKVHSTLASASGIWVTDPVAAQVARLYDTAFARLPDTAGLEGWKSGIESGSTTLAKVANVFVTSAEFTAKYGALDAQDFVTALYTNTLHRAPDQAGLVSWEKALASGVSRGTVVVGFSESAEHVALTAPNVISSTQYGIRFA